MPLCLAQVYCIDLRLHRCARRTPAFRETTASPSRDALAGHSPRGLMLAQDMSRFVRFFFALNPSEAKLS
jgi:hypothetical protein